MKRWALFFVMYAGMTLFLLWAVASRAEICPYPVSDLVVLPVPIVLGSAHLSWTPPTTNTDDSPLTDLGGYTVYLGTMNPPIAAFSEISNPVVTEFTVEDLIPNTYYFGVTAWDTEAPRRESELSNVVSKTIGN